MADLPSGFWLFLLAIGLLLWSVLGLCQRLLLRRPSPPPVLQPVVVPAGGALVLRTERVLRAEEREALSGYMEAFRERHGISIVVLEGDAFKVAAVEERR